ncbi:hypothetical protein KR084_007133, partial [Drosophila pseudotakahashii]
SKVESKLVEMFIRCYLLLLAFNFLSAGRVPQLEERIIGGSDIDIELAPWQVSLQMQGHHICGGIIYSKDIIITAAHCRFDEEGRRLEAEHFKIRAGSALWNFGGSLVQVAAIESHENFFNPFYKNKSVVMELGPYDINFIVHDIAVMRLSEPLELSNRVQTIPLAETSPAGGTEAFSSGWGTTYIYERPIHLQGIRVQINWPQYCRGAENIICVRHHDGPTCRGDSGGPLVVMGHLVGVVSAGTCTGHSEYTNVPYYREWILSAITSF